MVRKIDQLNNFVVPARTKHTYIYIYKCKTTISPSFIGNVKSIFLLYPKKCALWSFVNWKTKTTAFNQTIFIFNNRNKPDDSGLLTGSLLKSHADYGFKKNLEWDYW